MCTYTLSQPASGAIREDPGAVHAGGHQARDQHLRLRLRGVGAAWPAVAARVTSGRYNDLEPTMLLPNTITAKELNCLEREIAVDEGLSRQAVLPLEIALLPALEAHGCCTSCLTSRQPAPLAPLDYSRYRPVTT